MSLLQRSSLLLLVAITLLFCISATTTVSAARACRPGVPTFHCLVDPCRTISADTCALGCISDYCGGCNARCACRVDSDCATGETCQHIGSHMLRARRLGTCSGLAPSDAAAVAAATEPTTTSCSAESPCADANQYCDASQHCRSQGECETPGDCEFDPSFMHMMCTGVFTCKSNRCGFQCITELVR